MSATFARTLRSLEADRPRRRMAAPLLGALLIAWIAWFGLGRVTIYEVTSQARLEVQSAAHPVAAPVGGRIVETRLAVGREVRAGEVLVALDDAAEQLAIREKRVYRDALVARLVALQEEVRAEQEATAAKHEARSAASAESRALAAEAEARARLAQRQAARLAALLRKSAASDEEYQRTQAEAEATRAAARALALATARREQDRTVDQIDRKVRLARLGCEAVEIQGNVATEEAALRRLEYELAQRTVRAPVSGQVGELAAEFRVGSVVRPAERLCTIVPRGRPRAVALFPAAAIGRIRRGQPARLRLAGFVWTQYGALPATVADVANEPSSGRIRVELTLDLGRTTPIPLGHGLPGSAEVAIERVSPAVLVLRAAGQLLAVDRPNVASLNAWDQP
jgi:multidrug resistance efflux pump